MNLKKINISETKLKQDNIFGIGFSFATLQPFTNLGLMNKYIHKKKVSANFSIIMFAVVNTLIRGPDLSTNLN